MQILVQNFTGKIFPLECESMDTIAHIKARLNAIVGLPLHQQTLIFAGTRLDDFSENKTLADIGIQEKSLLSLLSRLPGGGGGEIERPRIPEKAYLHYADAFKHGWREEHGRVFLQLLLKLCRDSGMKEGKMTDQTWLWIQNGLNCSAQCGFQIDFLRERLRDYQKLYLLLTESSSPIFHWDRESKTIRIKSNWRECHPELLMVCGEYIPYFDTLEEVCLLLSRAQSPEQRVVEIISSRKTLLSKVRYTVNFKRRDPLTMLTMTILTIEILKNL